MFTNDDFSIRLIFLRKKAGLTQKEIASIIHIERSTYAYYETGKTTPSYKVVEALCNLYQVTADWLLFGKPIFDNEKTLCDEIESFCDYNREEVYKKFRKYK